MTQSGKKLLQLENTAESGCVYVRGDWVLAHYSQLTKEVNSLHSALNSSTKFDLSELTNLDTAGASLLVDLLGHERMANLSTFVEQLSVERQVLLKTVAEAKKDFESTITTKKTSALMDVLEHIGRGVAQFYKDAIAVFNFMGITLEILAKSIVRPNKWRITSLVANVEQIGLNAIPIVVLLTFMVGAVISFLGATVLASFGATIYTVNLVVFAFLREFAVLLAAILIAGRTASAFTAQLGLMKANEEIDAIQALGLNPIELLVLPRTLALLISLPILTFIGMISGIVGGMVVCAFSLDISPLMFLSIAQDGVEIKHFYVGMVKAPIFAFIISVIGCLEGFKVTGSSTSVGQHTTASVVHSIFVVILLDAVAALYFMEMGW